MRYEECFSCIRRKYTNHYTFLVACTEKFAKKNHLLAFFLMVWTSRNKIRIYGEELLAPRPNPKQDEHPLSAVRDCLFNIFESYPPSWRPFLHPKPQDAPCRGDRDPLITYHLTGTVVNAVLNLRIPLNAWNFLTSWEPVSFSKRTLLHGVLALFLFKKPLCLRAV